VKNSSLIYVYVLAAVLVPSVSAKAVKADSTKKSEYLSGTVLEVQQHGDDSASNYVGDTPSNAPLQSNLYIYYVSVRVNCATYVGRYMSAFNYVPSVFTPSREIKVHLRKHVMQVDVPGEEKYTMGIVEHPRGSTRPCRNQD
jgi:hypothetical protein